MLQVLREIYPSYIGNHLICQPADRLLEDGEIITVGEIRISGYPYAWSYTWWNMHIWQ